MPSIKQVNGEVISFLGDDIILGHNTSIDVRFLEAGFQEELSNRYMDTMQFSRSTL